MPNDAIRSLLERATEQLDASILDELAFELVLAGYDGGGERVESGRPRLQALLARRDQLADHAVALATETLVRATRPIFEAHPGLRSLGWFDGPASRLGVEIVLNRSSFFEPPEVEPRLAAWHAVRDLVDRLDADLVAAVCVDGAFILERPAELAAGTPWPEESWLSDDPDDDDIPF